MRDIRLRSGKWRWSLRGFDPQRRPYLELIDPAAPENKMLVRPAIPADTPPDTAPDPAGALAGLDAHATIDSDAVAEAARDPEVRLWTDEFGIRWRISRAGPDSPFPGVFDRPHLVFDSTDTFAGIVVIDASARLGDLQDEELRHYRDDIRDVGGRRRAFRAPA